MRTVVCTTKQQIQLRLLASYTTADTAQPLAVGLSQAQTPRDRDTALNESRERRLCSQLAVAGTEGEDIDAQRDRTNVDEGGQVDKVREPRDHVSLDENPTGERG